MCLKFIKKILLRVAPNGLFKERAFGCLEKWWTVNTRGSLFCLFVRNNQVALLHSFFHIYPSFFFTFIYMKRRINVERHCFIENVTSSIVSPRLFSIYFLKSFTVFYDSFLSIFPSLWKIICSTTKEKKKINELL